MKRIFSSLLMLVVMIAAFSLPPPSENQLSTDPIEIVQTAHFESSVLYVEAFENPIVQVADYQMVSAPFLGLTTTVATRTINNTDLKAFYGTLGTTYDLMSYPLQCYIAKMNTGNFQAT